MELERGFERKAQAALLDEAESELIGGQANLAFQFVELVHARLRSYGKRHGYDVESTIDSLGTVEVSRTGNAIKVTVGWESEQMDRWEFGISPHTIRGKPILSFVWADPPDWIKEEFDQARGGGGQFESGWRVFLPEVDHPGIPESRAIRDSIHGLRELLSA